MYLISIAIMLIVIPSSLRSREVVDKIILNSSYSSLANNLTIQHFQLSRSIILDRKVFTDIWIYKNGFLTLGMPLEEDSYPVMMAESRFDQPFENLIGSNILAVFITANQYSPTSQVRARHIAIESMDWKNNKNSKLYEKKISEVYGKYLNSRFEHVVEIEWIEMSPLGTDDKIKNSFRLYLISTKYQTFSVFQYWEIKTGYYRKLSQKIPYQAGIITYRDKKYILPTYDVTGQKISLDKSSNIGIKNTWMIAVGDSSYNIDIGWLSPSVDASLEDFRVDNKSSTTSDKSLRIMKKVSTKLLNDISKTMSPSSVHYITSRKFSKNLNTLSTFKEFITKNSDKPLVKETRISASNNVKLNTFKLDNEKISTKTSKISEISDSSSKAIFKYKKFDKLLNDLSDSTDTTYPTRYNSNSVGKLEESVRSRTIEAFRNNPITESVLESVETLLMYSTTKINENLSLNNYKTKQTEKNYPEINYWKSQNEENFIMKPTKDLDIPICVSTSCNENEECFMWKGKTCCKCIMGTLFRDMKCRYKDESFSIDSTGIVHILLMGRKLRLNLSLLTVKHSSNLQRTQMILSSSTEITEEVRNLIIILYPLFHIPMAFYASSWRDEEVPNMSVLVDEVAGIHIYMAIGEYQDIYLSFKLDRQNKTDKWTISLDAIDMIRFKDLNLQNLKLDEKFTGKHNLMYTLLNSNSIEFPEQSVTFYDEKINRSLRIKWRGTMTFSPTCYSNQISNRQFYIKFSEKRYCNSECYLNDNRETMCRVICLSFPNVFDKIPEPCQGNICETNRTCLNKPNGYECKCSTGFKEIGQKCVVSHVMPLSTIPTRKWIKGCSDCSVNANCRIQNNKGCCLCKNGYIGSGITCWKQDRPYNIIGSGHVQIIPSSSTMPIKSNIKLSFQLWQTQSGLDQLMSMDLINFPYSSIQDQKLLNFILFLSPLFDIPLSVFATSRNHQSMNNLYDLSKGFFNLKITVESNKFNAILIRMNVRERQRSLLMTISVNNVPSDLDQNLLLNSINHFNRKQVSTIKYSILGNVVSFKKHNVNLVNVTKEVEVWWKATGELHGCTKIFPKKNFEVINERYFCNARCSQQFCSPHCQSSPILQEMATSKRCEVKCHDEAKCLNGSCVCPPGFSGNGMSCKKVRKILECRNSEDCKSKQFSECLNKNCVCKSEYRLEKNKCVFNEKCQFCKKNEMCIDGKCLCKNNFVKNRISQDCVFDCSSCDIYSMNCDDRGCSCKLGYVTNTKNNYSCDLTCKSDYDCPTNEKCGSLNTCFCHFPKQNDVCPYIPVCKNCHKNATCIDDVCKCNENWIGNGSLCNFNCSVCYDSDKNCNSQLGCACPSGYKGNGKNCHFKPCDDKCPMNSLCENINNQYQCVCVTDYVMVVNNCIEDPVQLSIMPPDKTVEVTEGSDIDFFCLGNSRFVSFNISWSRKSGRFLNGIQSFQLTSKATSLRLDNVKLQDSDQYICTSSTGKEVGINLSILKAKKQCFDKCSKFGSCVNGMCKCWINYYGNGTDCAIEKQCQPQCSPDKICDKTTGKCECRKGFVLDENKCVADCRIANICDNNAMCNTTVGLCKCRDNFVGNGTKCWRSDSNCLLTKRCGANSKCRQIDNINLHICVCNTGYIGDGALLCHKKIDCSIYACGAKSYCETIAVTDSLGSTLINGKCTCEPGFIIINNTCQDEQKLQNTLWVSMGESLIRRKLNENVSKIQYIDLSNNNNNNNNDNNGLITSLTHMCQTKRLIWSGQNGAVIKSAVIGKLTETTTHISFNFGKVMGLFADQDTGNLFFTDNTKGRIGVVNVKRNISRILIEIAEYSPGPICVYSSKQKLFWIVNDYQNPSIESSDMTGENKNTFISLHNRPVSLVIAPGSDSLNDDQLCWIEVNDQISLQTVSSESPIKAFLKCTSTKYKHSPLIQVMYRIRNDEPYSTLEYVDKTFYWNVRNRKYIRSWGPQGLSKINIHPNCCDTMIRGLIITNEQCDNKLSNNPCMENIGNGKCSQLCIPKRNVYNQLEAVCLNGNL